MRKNKIIRSQMKLISVFALRISRDFPLDAKGYDTSTNIVLPISTNYNEKEIIICYLYSFVLQQYIYILKII